MWRIQGTLARRKAGESLVEEASKRGLTAFSSWWEAVTIWNTMCFGELCADEEDRRLGSEV